MSSTIILDLPYTYDFFISYPTPLFDLAIEIRNILSKEFLVFLDESEVTAGEFYGVEIPKAQSSALCSLILISVDTEHSIYQGDEIDRAIKLTKANDPAHLILPFFIASRITSPKVPFGLNTIKAIYLENKTPNELVPVIAKALLIFKRKVKTKSKPLLKEKPQDHEYAFSKPQTRMDYEERSKFEDHILSVIKRHGKRKTESFLIYFDIDKIGGINQKFGFYAGSQVIETVENIAKSLTADHYLKKIGYDEFVICLENKDISYTFAFLTNLLRQINTFNWERIAPDLYVTICAGYAGLVQWETPTSLSKNLNDWILRAMKGCKQAKKEGGNRYEPGPNHIPISYHISYGIGDS